MIKVGLTGNIGSGKSTVAKIFSTLNIPVYHADTEAKKFLDTPPVISELRFLFGESIIEKNRVNRKALAKVVFNDKEKLNQLNNIIHPFVKEDYMKWCENQKEAPYTVQEAAVLVESGFDKLMDQVVVVAAPMEIRIDRIMARDSVSKNHILNRMEMQYPESTLKEHADFVIDNSGKSHVIPQVLKIHKELLNIAGQFPSDSSQSIR